MRIHKNIFLTAVFFSHACSCCLAPQVLFVDGICDDYCLTRHFFGAGIGGFCCIGVNQHVGKNAFLLEKTVCKS